MSPTVPIALLGWCPIVILLFRDMRGYKAVTISFIGSLLFLPCAGIQNAGLPDLNKISITSYASLLATMFFNPGELLKFRPKWIDLPMFLYCVLPIPSAVVNNLGISHGISLSIVTCATWGLPYFLGRLYFTSFESIHFLAKAIFIGGLIYIPFCLYELRMSPQLHRMVYGFHPSSWNVVRFGGFRPNVFMKHGLQLGLWMTAAMIMGYSLWRFKVVKKLFGIDIRVLLLSLFVITVLCKSTGALLLLVGGIFALAMYRLMRTPVFIVALALVSIGYISVRATSAYDFSDFLDGISQLSKDRAKSLEFRLKHEDLLIARALEMPYFGWGGLGRNRVHNEYGKDVSVTDGFWVITLGLFGFFGLASVYFAFMIIPVLAAIKYRRREFELSEVGTTVAISMFLLLFLIDCLLNAMPTGIYPVALGAISTVYITKISISAEAEQTVDVVEPVLPRRLWPPRKVEPQSAT